MSRRRVVNSPSWGPLGFRCVARAALGLAACGTAFPTAVAWGADPRGTHVEYVTGSTRHAPLSARLTEQELVLQTCSRVCPPDAPRLALPVPEEARRLPREVRTIRLSSGEKLLFVRYGTNAEFYSFLALGASSEESDRAPRLLLKGWTKEASGGLYLSPDDENPRAERVLVRGPATNDLCGRSRPSWVKHFDPATESFHRVRTAPLSESERATAAKLEATAYAPRDEEAFLRLVSPGSQSTSAAVDGLRGEVWDKGHDWVRLTLFSEREEFPERLVLQLAEPAEQSGSLWLAAGTSLFEVALVPQNQWQIVTIPEQARGKCLALIQPHDPAPLVEVMGVEEGVARQSLVQWVKQLDSERPGRAGAALLLGGDSAADALSSVYAKLGPHGQEGALAVAPHFSGSSGARLEATIAAQGSDEASRHALTLLKARGPEAFPVASEVLVTLDVDEGRPLADFLIEAQPQVALEAALLLLNREEPGGRQLGADVLFDLSRSEGGRDLVDELLDPSSETRSAWSRRATLGVIRALSPDERLVPRLERLAAKASFEEAYVLSPLVLPYLDRSKVLTVALGDWLLGKFHGKESPVRTAALSVRVVEVLFEAAPSPDLSPWRDRARRLLSSNNVRARKAGLDLLGSAARQSMGPTEKSNAPWDPVGLSRAARLLKKDPWPRVRAAAGRMLGLSSAVPAVTPEDKEWMDRLLVSRLKRDSSELVRRAVARSLADSDRPRVVRGLRRAMEKDASYEVRAEAALALGRLCDRESLPALTRSARRLSQGVIEEGEIALGMASLTALAQMGPADFAERVAPLLSDQVPGPLRARIQVLLEEFERGDRRTCGASQEPSEQSLER